MCVTLLLYTAVSAAYHTGFASRSLTGRCASPACAVRSDVAELLDLFDALKAEHERLEEQERKLLAQTLQRHDGVVARAAKALGMSRTSLVSRLSTLGIER